MLGDDARAAICNGGSDASDTSSSEDDSEPDVCCGATCFVFVAVFSTTAALNIGVVLLTSSITELGVWFYDWVADEDTAILGWWLRRFAFSGGGLCLAVVYLLDMWRWKGCLRSVFKPFMVLATFVFALGILFATPKFPDIPFFYGIMGIISTTKAWQLFIFKPMGFTRRPFYEGSALAYLVASVVLFGVWLAWLAWPDKPAFSQRVTDMVTDASIEDEPPIISDKAAWILFVSPAALAVAHLIMACFVWMRGRFGLHSKDSNPGSVDLAKEVKIMVMVLVFIGFGGYIAAVLGAGDMVVGRLVMTYTGITFLLVFVYLVRWVGLGRLEVMAMENSTVQTAAGIVANDWVKALVVLLGPPVVPVFVAVESIHQCCRGRLQRCGVLDSAGGDVPRRCTHLTSEADILWHEGRDFLFSSTTSVLTKAIYWAIGISFMIAFGSTGIGIFLEWVNSQLEALSLGLFLLVVFVVVVLLFLFPPISGQVIYGFAATVIAPRYGYDESSGFWTGIMVSSALCLLGKLVGTTVQMKCIGGLGKNSVYVKQSIGVHTNFMKAFRYVLTRPGCSAGKVAILTFGQDFATSVLTGILDLPLVPMLVGTLPVIVVIVPCCISLAYTARAGQDEEHEAQHKAIAALNLVLSAIVAAAGNAGIWYYVQEALHANQDELDREGSDWMADPLEKQVLAAVAAAEVEEKEWSSKTRWATLPCSMRFCLGLGLALSTVTAYTMMQPVHRAFVKFSVGDKISDLPGGTPLGAVNPLGWLVIFSTMTLVVLVSVFNLWGRRAVAEPDSDDGGDSEL